MPFSPLVSAVALGIACRVGSLRCLNGAACGGDYLRFFGATSALARDEAAFEPGFEFFNQVISAEGAAGARGMAEAVEGASETEVEGEDFYCGR